jgi:hypothetical protein
MIQVHTCVSVHCAQCGDSPGSPGFEAHYPTEDAALDAAAAQGWRIGSGGRLLCSACGPVLTCEAAGHQFSQWRQASMPEGHLVAREYRYCRRCCLHESHTARAVVLGEVA